LLIALVHTAGALLMLQGHYNPSDPRQQGGWNRSDPHQLIVQQVTKVSDESQEQG